MMKYLIQTPSWILGSFILLATIGVPTSVLSADSALFNVSDSAFQAPSSWKKVTARSSMRKAQFSVERKGIADKGEVVFFYFGPGGAGGTQANVQRWFRQFKEPLNKLGTKTERLEVDSTAVTVVKATGTFLSGSPVGPKTPKTNYSLLGAIIEAPKGHIFIKFTGPRDLVDDAEKEFVEMIKKAKIGG